MPSLPTIATPQSQPTPPVSEPMPPSIPPELPKAFPKWIIIGIILFLLAATSVFAYKLILTNKVTTPPEPTPTASAQPTPTPQTTNINPSPTPDPTANWKTYTSQFYSFKYPPEWEAQQPNIYGSGSETGFEYNYGFPFYVRHIGNYNQLTGKAYSSLEEYLGNRSSSAKDIQIDNHPAKYISDPGEEGHALVSEGVLVFVPDQSFILGLYYQPESDKADVKTFDQILSTFKFLDFEEEEVEGKFCGGITGAVCPESYFCKYDGNYPDASGVCIKNSISP